MSVRRWGTREGDYGVMTPFGFGEGGSHMLLTPPFLEDQFSNIA